MHRALNQPEYRKAHAVWDSSGTAWLELCHAQPEVQNTPSELSPMEGGTGA